MVPVARNRVGWTVSRNKYWRAIHSARYVALRRCFRSYKTRQAEAERRIELKVKIKRKLEKRRICLCYLNPVNRRSWAWAIRQNKFWKAIQSPKSVTLQWRFLNFHARQAEVEKRTALKTQWKKQLQAQQKKVARDYSSILNVRKRVGWVVGWNKYWKVVQSFKRLSLRLSFMTYHAGQAEIQKRAKLKVQCKKQLKIQFTKATSSYFSGPEAEKWSTTETESDSDDDEDSSSTEATSSEIEESDDESSTAFTTPSTQSESEGESSSLEMEKGKKKKENLNNVTEDEVDSDKDEEDSDKNEEDCDEDSDKNEEDCDEDSDKNEEDCDEDSDKNEEDCDEDEEDSDKNKEDSNEDEEDSDKDKEDSNQDEEDSAKNEEDSDESEELPEPENDDEDCGFTFPMDPDVYRRFESLIEKSKNWTERQSKVGFKKWAKKNPDIKKKLGLFFRKDRAGEMKRLLSEAKLKRGDLVRHQRRNAILKLMGIGLLFLVIEHIYKTYL